MTLYENLAIVSRFSIRLSTGRPMIFRPAQESMAKIWDRRRRHPFINWCRPPDAAPRIIQTLWYMFEVSELSEDYQNWFSEVYLLNQIWHWPACRIACRMASWQVSTGNQLEVCMYLPTLHTVFSLRAMVHRQLTAAGPPLYSKKQVVSTLPTTSHRASVEQITRGEFSLYFSTLLNTFICDTVLLLWCNVQATVTYVVSTIRRSTATCNWSAIINKCNNTRGLVMLFCGILNKTHQMWGSIICVDSSQRSISPSRSIETIRRWNRKSEGV